MKKVILSLMMIVMMGLIYLSSTYVFANTWLEPLVVGNNPVTYWNTTEQVMVPIEYEEKAYEMRGVWVATVWNIDFPRHQNETQYKQAYDSLIADLKAKNYNTIFFQVRGHNDAFYESQLAPYSLYLNGAQGSDPGWDVMEYFVETAHANGMEFHAWLNPYRVGTGSSNKQQYLNGLHDDNFAKQNPDLVLSGSPLDAGTPYILDPGQPAVQQYLFDVVEELMEKYDIDGVHFDDYFYINGTTDTQTYNQHRLNASETVANFRRRSVNQLISGVKDLVDGFNETNNKNIKFGVSPFAIWQNRSADPLGSNTNGGQSYGNYWYADSRKWVKEEWVHYIAPQIYWQFNHPQARYADVTDWWVDVVKDTNVDLIIGHSAANAASWHQTEIGLQLKYNSKHPEIKGSIMYSAQHRGNQAMLHLYQTYWTQPTLGVWEESDVTQPTIDLSGILSGSVYTSNVTITLTGEHNIEYRLNDGDWLTYDDPLIVLQNGNHTIYYRSIDAQGDYSLMGIQSFTIAKVNDDVPLYSIDGTPIGNQYLVGATVTFTSTTHPIWVRINHGQHSVDWHLYEEPIVLSDTTQVQGRYIIFAKTIDPNDGVESTEITVDVQVTQGYSDPILDIAGIGLDPHYQSAEVNIISNSPNLSYRLNNGSWQSFVNPFEITEEGTYIIEYRNDSNATVFSKTFIIVADPEEPVIHIAGTLIGNEYETPATVTFESGNTIYYRIHFGSSWSNYQEYDEPIVFDRNGIYTLAYFAENQAGVVTEIEEVRIRINMIFNEDNPYVIRNGNQVYYYGTNTPVQLPVTYSEKKQEIRAVWIATVNNIDIAQHTNEEVYKQRIIDILDTLVAHNFNTLFFQVRPMNDAFYESEYAPWSRYLTGIEGQNPGWNVLEFMIQEAHTRGIEFHAWLNPYRVATGNQSKEVQLALLHETNFARMNPDFVLVDNNNSLILNPGEPQVRAYIENIVQELMENYDVDGIHFDDYFYSYAGMQDVQDIQTFIQHNPNNLTLADWRRENINILVESLFNRVEQFNQDNEQYIKFGISPFGIWQSGGTLGSNTSSGTMQSYHDQYADTRKWVKENWLHYIMPQLYWQFDHNAAPFADLVDWWVDVVKDTNVELIIGQGFYRYAEASNNWTDADELLEQLRYMSQYEEISGSAFFSYRTLHSANPLVTQALARLNNFFWTDRADFTWASNVEAPHPNPDPDPDPEPTPEDPQTNNPVGLYVILGIIAVIVIGGASVVILKKK